MRRAAVMVHEKCRCALGAPYTRVPSVLRAPVPEALVPWSVPWPEYLPPDFTSPAVLGKPWADPDDRDPNFNPQFNSLDGAVDRRSHEGKFVVADGRPLNPHGRTGLAGRGVLGRWGPNHAADPVVTRWKPGQHAVIAGKRVLQFVAIQRRDSGEWALPGGMVDPGEAVSATLRREFLEEALNVLQDPEKEKLVGDFFSNGEVVFSGYVDDPRNTDNAWMETVASHFHDAEGTAVGALPLQAGDDAVGVRWTDVSGDLRLYASHSEFLRKVAEKMDAHW